MGGHSFRRGRAVELFHGNASRETVTEVLRHRSAASTRPYITDSARVASLAVTMAAATADRCAAAGPPGHHPDVGGAPVRVGRHPGAPLRLQPGAGPFAGRLEPRGRGVHPPAADLLQLLAGRRGRPGPDGRLAAPVRSLPRPELPAGPGSEHPVPAANGRPDPRAPLRGRGGPPAGA
jgi:hypothetical protein